VGRANVYIDGFNLYYALRERFPECKWLDLRKVAERLYPADDIQRVRYFTAKVTARPSDPTQPQRQQTYLRALETTNVEPHFGQFSTHPRHMHRVETCQVAGCPSPDKAHVLRTEEKGSDVALASYLLRDSFVKEMDIAIVLTNDTDLAAPLQIARGELGMAIALVSPHKYAHENLRAHADSVKKLRRGLLEASQLPLTLHDANGRAIHCPPSWRPQK
jgi:uncharacterized LabA/DUF88 family protein